LLGRAPATLAIWLLFLGSLGLAVPPSLPGVDWPHWRGPERDGKTSESLGGAEELRELWTAEVGIGFSSFSVVAGRVYTMGNENETDTVWCLDAATGETLWRHDYPCELHPRYYEGGPGATPTVSEGAVFTLSKRGHAFAFDAGSGRVLWQRDLVDDYGLELPEWNFAGSPYPVGDLIVLNVGGAGLALDRENGDTVWRSGPEVTGYATPVPMPEAMGRPGALALLRKEFLSAIDPFTGEIFWSAPYQSLNATDPVIEGRDVLLSSIGGSVLLRLETDGETTSEVWARKDYRNYFNPPVKVGDHLYGFDGTTHNPTRLVCIDWATGEERWGVEGHATGGLILAGDLLVACDQGEILLFRPDPDRFDLVLRETVLPGKCWTAPVVSGGRLYARNAAGRVVCLEAVGPSAPQP